jgi:hypothetical protein
VYARLSTVIDGGSIAAQTARLGTAIAAALAVLALSSHLLRIAEFREGVAILRRRIGRPRR